jgi:hypothetical protein
MALDRQGRCYLSLKMAPVPAEVTSLAYLPRYPPVITGVRGLKLSFLLVNSSSLTNKVSFLPGMSMAILSPSRMRAIVPPSAASGDM